MGGPIERDALSSFSYELPISQIKVELESNIIPIGRIHSGIYYHRALLFKVTYPYSNTSQLEKKPLWGARASKGGGEREGKERRPGKLLC